MQPTRTTGTRRDQTFAPHNLTMGHSRSVLNDPVYVRGEQTPGVPGIVIPRPKKIRVMTVERNDEVRKSRYDGSVVRVEGVFGRLKKWYWNCLHRYARCGMIFESFESQRQKQAK